MAAIGNIADEDPELARRVVGLKWLHEELTDAQLLTIVRIGFLAHEEPSLARDIGASPGVADDVTEEEGFVLDLLLELASDDPSIARRIVNSPEIDEGIRVDELVALAGSQTYFRDRLRGEHPKVWEIISRYPWISEGDTGKGNIQTGLQASPLPVDGLNARNQWALAII